MLENLFSVKSLLPLLFLLFSTESFATNYYVSSTGNDANSGKTVLDAWATISKVNSMIFLPGDALFFEGGQTFSGSIFLNSSDANDPGNIFVISTYGSGRATINAGSSYGLYAYNTQGFSISNLIFDGNAAATNADAGIKVIADLPGDVKFSHISISHIEIKNFGAEGVVIFGSNGLTGYQNLMLNDLSVHDITKNGIIIYCNIKQATIGWPHKDITVSNCEVYNVPGTAAASAYEGNGIVLSGVDGGVIQYCVAHDNGQNNSHCGGPGGIWSLESNKLTIQFCESYRNHKGTATGCDGMGFDFDGGMTNSVMEYNYSHDNDGAGYLLGQYENARPWSNNTVRFNISENDGVLNEGAIGLFKGPNTSMSGAYIYNNTIYVSPQAANSDESAVYFKNWTTGIDDVNFYNNIFITTGSVPLVNIPNGYSAFFAGNIYWSSGAPFAINYRGISYSSLDNWRTSTGNEKVNTGNTGFNSDPLLTNAGFGGTVGFGNSLFSLNAYKISNITSPAFQAALDLSLLYSINTGNIDFWGTALPGGNTNSIGSNQFSVTLPIKLLDFHGSCSGLGDDLYWATAEETDVKSFELMYSHDGRKFSKLADIKPKGMNSRYNYVNEMTTPGNNYYQLRMTDLDGSITYSAIVNIHCEKAISHINVWPNPFSRSLHVSIASANRGPATLFIFNAVGKMVSQKNLSVLGGDNEVYFDGMDHLPAGIYYLRIVNQDKMAYFKLIKAGK